MGRPLILGDLMHNGFLNERENNTHRHTHTHSPGGVRRDEGRTPTPSLALSRGVAREFWLPSQSVAPRRASVVRRSLLMPTRVRCVCVRFRVTRGSANGINTPLWDQTEKRAWDCVCLRR